MLLRKTIQKTFAILSTSFRTFPNTALHCILNMGKAVYQTDDSDLVDYFIEKKSKELKLSNIPKIADGTIEQAARGHFQLKVMQTIAQEQMLVVIRASQDRGETVETADVERVAVAVRNRQRLDG